MIIFSGINVTWEEVCPLNANVFDVVFELILSECPTVLTVKFFSTNYSNFAVVWDWNSKQDFPKGTNFSFFEEIGNIFQKGKVFSISLKVKNFLNAYQKILFQENVFFHTWIRGFFAEIRKKNKFGKINELLWENAFIPLKDVLSRIRGREICKWWPAVLLA